MSSLTALNQDKELILPSQEHPSHHPFGHFNNYFLKKDLMENVLLQKVL